MKNLLFAGLFVFGFNAFAGKAVDYKAADGTVLAGYTASPTTKGKHPAVLVVHDWMGPSKYTQDKVDQLAKEGYVAFAADIYGKANLPKDQKEAAAAAGKYKGDIPLLRSRVESALAELKKQPGVDENKIVAIGYCFGGTTVIELARTGTPLAGVATFHGGLTSNAADASKIKAKMLIMHGGIDPYVPMKDVETFKTELDNAKVDYQFIAYSGAVHSFTIPTAGNDIKAGAAYNPVADHRSWLAFEQFMKEVAPQ